MPFNDVTDVRETPIPESGREMTLAYDGETATVANIACVNGLLTLITLGIYRFWAKTKLRRYVWSRVSVDGDRLEYSGLAKELLIGFLVAMAILIPIFAIDFALDLTLGPSPWTLAVELAYGILLWFLINYALFRARRYRMTRTNWRGIRFRQTGSARRYAFTAMGWQFLTGLTLGLAYPAYRMRVQGMLIENTWVGSEKFSFHGRGGELFGTWFIAWLLFYPSLGISYLWYRAREYNYVASMITAKGFRAEARMRTGQVLKIVLIFLIPLALTGLVAWSVLGALWPEFMSVAGEGEDADLAADFLSPSFAVTLLTVLGLLFVYRVLVTTLLQHPLLRLACESTTLHGGNDLDSLLQVAASEVTHGEGLADVLDLGDF